MDLVIRSLRDTLALLTGSCRCRVSCMCMAVLDVNGHGLSINTETGAAAGVLGISRGG